MPKWAKWLLFGIAITGACVGGVAWIGLRALDPDRLIAAAAAQTKAATGRDLVVGGNVSVRIFPVPAVIAEDIRFSNASSGSRPDMIRVRHAEGHVAFWPLLLGRVQIRRIVLAGADALFETDNAGTGNWVFRHEGGPVAEAETVPQIALDLLRIEDSQIIYRNRNSKHETELAVERFTLDGNDSSELVDMTATLRGQRFGVKGSAGRLESMLANSAAIPVDLAFATDGATAAVKGTLGAGKQVGELDLAVEAAVTDAAGLSRLVGVNLSLPLPLELSAKARRRGTENIVDPFRLTLGSHMLSGRATLSTGVARPLLDASIVALSLDLSQFAQAKGKHAGPDAATSQGHYVISDAPLPFRELPAIDVQADVRIEQMIAPNRVVLKSLRAGIALKNGHVGLQPLMFHVAGGVVTGHMTLDDMQGKAPRLAVKLEGKGVSLEELAGAVGRAKQISGGRADLAIDLSGSGQSLHGLMAGANGDIRIAIGPARLSNNLRDVGGDSWAKLIDTLSPGQTSGKGTDLKCAVARLPIRGGVITVDRSIAYETADESVVIAGTINLRDESLALLIRPDFNQGLALGKGNLAKLVRVTGTMANPSIGLDAQGLGRQLLSLYAAFATSGASLVVEEVLKRPTDPHPCQSALATGASKPK